MSSRTISLGWNSRSALIIVLWHGCLISENPKDTWTKGLNTFSNSSSPSVTTQERHFGNVDALSRPPDSSASCDKHASGVPSLWGLHLLQAMSRGMERLQDWFWWYGSYFTGMPPGDILEPRHVYPGHIYCSRRRRWPRSFRCNCVLDRWVHYTAVEWPVETRPCPTAHTRVDWCRLPSKRSSGKSGCCYQKLIDQIWKPGTHYGHPVPAMGRS